MRNPAKQLWSQARSRRHGLPDLLVLGAQKCGTTSLFAYLASLPGFLAPARKELHYYDRLADHSSEEAMDWGWYRSQFPLRRDLRAAGAITGEATPAYMLDPLIMNRIAVELPAARWIVVLRDPVGRAFSQYSARSGNGLETKTFAEQIERELKRLERRGPMRTKQGAGKLYVERGHFAEQLTHLGELRPDRPTLVLFSENIFAGEQSSFDLLHEFIGLPGPVTASFPHRNSSSYESAMEPEVRATLTAHYAQVNAGLGPLLRSDRFLTAEPALWPSWVEPGKL